LQTFLESSTMIGFSLLLLLLLISIQLIVVGAELTDEEQAFFERQRAVYILLRFLSNFIFYIYHYSDSIQLILLFESCFSIIHMYCFL
jgi:hypothetical protein